MGGIEGCDPAMLELFRAEMDTHVPVLSQGLLDLEKGDADKKFLEGMMRAAHSIKGAARIVGIEAAVRVAHAMEDCFSAAQDQQIAITSGGVDVLLQGVDALQRICSPQPESEVGEASLQSLLEELKEVREGRSPIRRAPEPTILDVAVPAAGPEAGCISLPAVIDSSAAETLRRALCDWLRGNVGRIRVDFSQVQCVSAAALSLFASFTREVSRMDPAPSVEAEGVPAEVSILLRATAMDTSFRRSV